MELLVVMIIVAAMGLGCLALGFGMFVLPMDASGQMRTGAK